MRRPSVFRLRSPRLRSPLGQRVAPPRPPPPPASGGPSCGADALSGLLLFRAGDGTGEAARPSLALAGPDGAIRGGVEVPDPREILRTPSGCRAVVRSGAGATFVVDGATGTARKLDLGDPAADLRYEWWVGGGRWGFFKNRESPLKHSQGRRTDARAALVDFATGGVTDLRPIDRAQFAPDGEALFATTLVGGYYESWLIPANDPRRCRAVGGRGTVSSSFDGRRLLYAEFDAHGEPRDAALDAQAQGLRFPFREGEVLVVGGERGLIVEGAADGRRVEIGRVPSGSARNATGWFLPGRPELLVQFPNRFALVDPRGGAPRELFSLDGAYASFDHVFYPAPSGQRGILQAYGADADPAPRFVDLERGTARRLEGDGGEPVRIEAVGGTHWLPGRWVLLSVGGDEGSPRELVSLDAETGAASPLLALRGRPRELGAIRPSTDGRTVLLTRRGDGDTTRLTVLDLERGTAIEVAEARSISADLSVDGRWAAYATLETADGERTATMTIVETATGARTLVGPGLEPVWLAP